MVMKQMRSQMKVIMWVVVVSFVVGFGFLMTGTGSRGGRQSKWQQGIAGEINGQVITVQQYEQARRDAIEQYRTKNGVDPNESVQREISNQAWQQLVSEVLLQQQYRKLGIRVYDEEIVQIIRNSPPRDMMQDERLFTNGKFDMAKYQQVISNPQNVQFMVEYETQLRKNLPLQKLQMQVLAGVHVTEDEVAKAYNERSEKARAQYIAVDLGRFFDPKAAAAPAEVAAYYKGHKKDFKAPERAKIAYVLFSKTATAGDSAAARQKIDEAYRELQTPGAKFDELAQSYSDDPGSAANGGDLGWFASGQMVPEFEKTAFSLRPGQTSRPFATQFGWHILRVDSAKTEGGKKMVKARHILVSAKAGEETLSDLRTKAESFHDAAKKDGIDKAAAEYGLQVVPTNYFQRGPYIPGLGALPELMAFAFEERAGSLSEVMENEQAYIVARAVDHKKEGVQPLADVEPRIKMLVLRDQAKQQAKELAAKVRGEIGAGGELAKAAMNNGLSVDTTGAITRQSFVPKAGGQNEFTAAVFTLPEGVVSQPVVTDQGAFIIKVQQRIPADAAQFEKERPAMMQQLYQQKQQQALQMWFGDVEQRSSIKDFRVGI